MNASIRVLDAFGGLAPRHVERLFEAAAVVDLRGLPRGVWRGRAGGGSVIYKRSLRWSFRQDRFATLLLDGWGIHLRTRQDASGALLEHADGRLRTCLPFGVGWDTLDYGFHVMGTDIGPPPLQMQDEVRVLSVEDFRSLAPPETVYDAPMSPGEGGAPTGPPLLLIAYVAPLGLHRFRGAPIAMVYERSARPEEERAARNHVARRRLYDTSPGPLRTPVRRSHAMPLPT